MGLDAYAKWTDGSIDVQSETSVHEEFKTWRKCSHIHNFFQKEYADATGITDPTEFNCVNQPIDFAVLNRFVTAVKTNSNTAVGGFFFGAEYDTTHPDIVEDDLRFAADCFFHLLMGRKVYYSSWW